METVIFLVLIFPPLFVSFQVETVIDKSRADPDSAGSGLGSGKSPSKVTFSEDELLLQENRGEKLEKDKDVRQTSIKKIVVSLHTECWDYTVTKNECYTLGGIQKLRGPDFGLF